MSDPHEIKLKFFQCLFSSTLTSCPYWEGEARQAQGQAAPAVRRDAAAAVRPALESGAEARGPRAPRAAGAAPGAAGGAGAAPAAAEAPAGGASVAAAPRYRRATGFFSGRFLEARDARVRVHGVDRGRGFAVGTLQQEHRRVRDARSQ